MIINVLILLGFIIIKTIIVNHQKVFLKQVVVLVG